MTLGFFDIRRPVFFNLVGAWLSALALLSLPSAVSAQPDPDRAWSTDATLKDVKVNTIADLGAIQGVSQLGDKLYLYGDRRSPAPRVGIMAEYSLDLKPTGKVIKLTRHGKPLLLHPTGLTQDPKWGTFVGDTVEGVGRIYQLDWNKALREGHLDNAIKATIVDDAAVNGCRPCFVAVKGRTLLATADYGNTRPEIRLLDPAAMLKHGRTSHPEVIVHRVLAGPFNQNLSWDAKKKQLTCIQNVVAGRGWQLHVFDLDKAVADGRSRASGVTVRTYRLPPHTELEGYCPLPNGQSLWVTAHAKDNLALGKLVFFNPPRTSPPGTTTFDLEKLTPQPGK